MCKYLLLWWCCTAAAVVMPAQVPLYPIHQQQKLGFIYLRGGQTELVIKPVYDAFSQPLNWHSLYRSASLSPFRMFEQNGKIGLLDDSLREALPARYHYILPLSLQYFAVRSDSMLQLAQRGGRLVVPDRFEDIYALDSDTGRTVRYFRVTKNQLQGIVSGREGLLFEPKFTQVAPAGPDGWFKVKMLPAQDKDQAWGLADKTGKVILPTRYADVKILHPRLLAVKILIPVTGDTIRKFLEKWKLVADGVEGNAQYDEIQTLNSHWVLAKNSGLEYKLWSLDSMKPVDCRCRIIKPLDENYLICWEFGLYSLWKNDLSLVAPPEYDVIGSSGLRGVYKVKKKGRWGLIQLESIPKLVLPCVYDSIGNFADSVAVVFKGQRGAVNYQFDTIIPCVFSTLFRVNAHQFSGQIANAGTVQTIMLDRHFGFQNMFTSARETEMIQVSDPNSWFEAPPLSLTENREFPENAPFQNFSWPDWSDFRADIRDRWAKDLKILLPMVVDKALGFRSKDQTLKLPYTPGFPAQEVLGITMGHPDGKRISGSPLMAGCMPFNRNQTYTVFVDSAGLMGLVDRTGRQGRDTSGKPLRLTYIGPFSCGLANACVGGRLVFELIRDGKKIFSPALVKSFEDRFGWVGQPISATFLNNYQCRVESVRNIPPKWGVIDTLGRWVVQPEFDFISDYFLPDSVANVGKYGAQPDDPLLFGLVDNRGKLRYPPKYQEIRRYKDYAITVNKAKPKYLFDPRGAFLIQQEGTPQFCLNGFREGLSPELDTNGRYGFRDTLGRFVLPGQYTRACYFSEGLAAVCLDSLAYWCFIDHSGQIVFQTTVPKKSPAALVGNERKVWLGMFKENRCYFRESGKVKYGYYNRQGEAIIPPAFLSATNFSKGVATISTVLKMDKTGLEIFGTIDSSGHTLLKASRLYKKIQPFNAAGMALAQIGENGRYVLLSGLGEPITEAYDSITAFVNGFARVRSQKKWGLIDALGKVCIALRFVEMDTVSEGLVAARSEPNGNWSYYDTAGLRLPMEGLTAAGEFKAGYAFVRIKGQPEPVLMDRGGNIMRVNGMCPEAYAGNAFVFSVGDQKYLTDRNGMKLWPKNFREIEPINADLFLVKDATGWGALNRRGMVLIPARYNRILQNQRMLQGVGARLYGLMSRDGRELLAPEYELLEEMSGLKSGHVFKVTRGGEIGYYDLRRGWVWALQK